MATTLLLGNEVANQTALHYRPEGRVIDFHPIAAGRERLCVLQAGS